MLTVTITKESLANTKTTGYTSSELLKTLVNGTRKIVLVKKANTLNGLYFLTNELYWIRECQIVENLSDDLHKIPETNLSNLSNLNDLRLKTLRTIAKTKQLTFDQLRQLKKLSKSMF